LYRYRCKIVNWVDGDTVDLAVDLGFRVTTFQRVRIFGVNAPEIHSKDAEEKRRGFAALAAAVELAPPGSPVVVQSHKSGEAGGGDKYGRWLAEISLSDGRDFARVMLAAGHLKPWDGSGKKPV
jgi:micrococcal nuclease